MKKIFFWLLCVLIHSSAYNQTWQRSIGPAGAWIWDIEKLNNKFIAATSQGLYKSFDQGETWQIDTSGIPPFIVIRDLAKKGNIVVAATSRGMYRSADGGNTWQISQYLEYAYYVLANDNVFLMQSYNGFTYSSVDGISWTYLNLGGNRIGKNGNTLFVANGINLKRSLDNGQTWTTVYTQQGGYNHIAGDGDVLLVSAVQAGFLRSTDNGSSFTAITSGLPAPGATGLMNVTAVGFDKDTIYAGIETFPHQIFVSRDKGLTWNNLNTRRSQKIPATKFYIDTSFMMAGSEMGIFKSSDRGLTWGFSADQGINNTEVNDILPLSNQQWFLAVGSSTEFGGAYGVVKTMNGGQNFQVPNDSAFDPFSNTKLITRVGNAMLLVNDFTMFRSVDNGNTWMSKAGLGFTPISFFVNGTRVFAGTDFQGLWYSDDFGAAWQSVLPNTVSVNGICRQGSVLFIATNGYVRKSVDGGLTWTISSNGIPATGNVVAIAANDNYVFCAVQSAGYSAIYRSADNGNTWTAISTSLPSSLYKAMAVKNDTIVIGSNIAGSDFNNTQLFRSTDNGNNWQDFSNGMYIKSDILLLKFMGDVLVAGTESAGLWINRLEPVVASPRIESLQCANTSGIDTATKGIFYYAGINIPYMGGNGFRHEDTLVFSSTQVAGLTATIMPDSLVRGSGLLKVMVSGIPDNAGLANFNIDFLGKNCQLQVPVKSQLEPDSIQSVNLFRMSSKQWKLTFGKPYSGGYNLLMYDASGKLVYKLSGQGEKVLLDLASLPAGIYSLLLKDKSMKSRALKRVVLY